MGCITFAGKTLRGLKAAGLLSITLFCSIVAIAQQRDTVSLKEVQVSGQLYEKNDDIIDVKKIAQPVLVIDRKTIAMMGSRRLDEVLREQTGMALVSDLGSGNRAVGLQMQGFSAAYIKVLINGQPMAGRINGNFDFSRINVADIERIEIIKGASSCLYGSDALGGVINIITRQTMADRRGTASLQYGTFHSLDALLEGETPFAHGKGAASLSGSYYRTDGFNVNNIYLKEGQTSPPYTSLQVQQRTQYRWNDNEVLTFGGRFSDRRSVMDRSYGVQAFSDQLKEQDVNIYASLNSQLANGFRLLPRYYITRYATDQSVKLDSNGHTLQNNSFVQTIQQLELQAAMDGKALSFTGGVGGNYQHIRQPIAGQNLPSQGSPGYDRSGQGMFNYFGYVQANYKPLKGYELMAGLRYDGNSVYGGLVSPSLGATITPVSWLALKASAGKGYKSPTYEQLYQVFTNITQGYTVVGAGNFQQAVQALQAAGQIQQLWPAASSIHTLAPETSTSLDASITLKPKGLPELTVNAFYNDIRNQIFSQQVGIMSNGQQLFSYVNIARSFTKGIETNLQWSPVKHLRLTAGYQYLLAMDKSVLDNIRAGKLTVRDVPIRHAVTADYFNLPGRSRNSATMQAFYELKGYTLSLRASYRGKYGFMDRDNNGFIDHYDVYVQGYYLFYASAQKKILKDRVSLQLSVDNIFNYTDYLMPAQPGRMIMAGFTYRCSGKK
jgi:outer membrane receptor for ferrienterochelin and colicins